MAINRDAMQTEIREVARKWIEAGEVRFVLGWEKSPNSDLSRPIFASSADDASRLVWNDLCTGNLTRYLVDELRKKPKRGEEPDCRPIGIVVKPCDSKALVELTKEKQIPEGSIKVIGVTCEGQLDPSRPEPGNDAYAKADKCSVCHNHNPLMADVVIGDEVAETSKLEDDDFSDVKGLEEMTTKERWEFWKRQSERCVRCYACRDACPMCYCVECIFDREKPYRWNDKTVDVPENVFYHVIRGLHLAGRCIDCGECERACPMDIPIRKINRYLMKRAYQRFGVKPGQDPEDESMFGSFDMNDPQEEIW